MPEFEQAAKRLPLDSLLEHIGDDGVQVSELLKLLQDEGVPRKVVLRVLRAYLDAGEIKLSREMKVQAAELAA